MGKGGEYAAVPMRCVLAEADIDAEHERREELGEDLQSSDDGRIGAIGSASSGVLIPISKPHVWHAHLLHLHRNAKEDDTLQPLLDQRSQEAFKLVDAPSLLPRQGLYDHLRIGIVGDEDGVDEHWFGQGSAAGLEGSESGMMDTAMED